MGKVLDRQDTWKGSVWDPENYVDPSGHVMASPDLANSAVSECELGDITTCDIDLVVSVAPSLEPGDEDADEAKWIPLGKGWKGRVDPPSPSNPNGKKHIHVYDPSGNEIGVWNDDGTISHAGKHKGTVPKGIKGEIEDKTGIKIPMEAVATAAAVTGGYLLLRAVGGGGSSGNGAGAIGGPMIEY